MSKQMNFLAERQKVTTQQRGQDQRWLRITGIIFGCVLGAFLLAFGITVYFQWRLRQLQMTEKQILGRIGENEAIEKSYVLFVNKLVALTDIDKRRQDKKDVIKAFTALLPATTMMSKIDFNESEKLLTFRTISEDIFGFRQVFQILQSPEVMKKFTVVNPSNMTRLSNGRYEINMTVSTEL